jgi:hypothetical protein
MLILIIASFQLYETRLEEQEACQRRWYATVKQGRTLGFSLLGCTFASLPLELDILEPGLLLLVDHLQGRIALDYVCHVELGGVVGDHGGATETAPEVFCASADICGVEGGLEDGRTDLAERGEAFSGRAEPREHERRTKQGQTAAEESLVLPYLVTTTGQCLTFNFLLRPFSILIKSSVFRLLEIKVHFPTIHFCF